jgi:hypothetical protein
MTAMNKEQASAVVAQLEMEERMENAFNTFIAEGGEAVARYLDGSTVYENAKEITAWALTNLGREALVIPSGWEIAFNNCRASLVADSKWRPASKIYADLEAQLTAQQFKQLCLGETPTLRADLAADLEKLGGVAVFHKFANGEVK